MALFGAGLSAPSGILTFRGSIDVFRGYDPPMLSTIDIFREDPVLTWWYTAFRRHRAMEATPNAAHYALATLASVKDFLAITQDIDGEFQTRISNDTQAEPKQVSHKKLATYRRD